MGISTFVHKGEIVVDDHVHLKNINSASNDVCRDQDFLPTLAEAVNHSVTLRSILGTVKRGNFVTLSSHSLRDSVRGMSMLGMEMFA